MGRKIRVLVGKPGLDGHDRGAKVVAAALRDAGMEVIYTGLHQTPEQVVEAAVQEDVDVVALSILSGAHMTLFPEVLELMKRRGIGDRLLTGGGIIPPEDMASLAAQGVGRLFGPGTSTQDIAIYIRDWFTAEHGETADAPVRAPAPTRPAPVAAPSMGPSEHAGKAAPARKPVNKVAKKTAREVAAKSVKKAAKKSAKKAAKKTAKKAAKRPMRKQPRKPATKRKASRKPARKKTARRR